MSADSPSVSVRSTSPIEAAGAAVVERPGDVLRLRVGVYDDVDLHGDARLPVVGELAPGLLECMVENTPRTSTVEIQMV